MVFYWGTVLYTQMWRQEKPSLSVWEIIPRVLFNQVIVMGGCLVFLELIGWNFGWEKGWEEEWEQMSVSWFFDSVLRMTGMVLVMKFLFFCMHLLAHSWKWLYINVHSVHHRLVISNGMGALYCHPLEHVFVNMMSVVGGLLMFNGESRLLGHIFVAFVSSETILGHTVYCDLKSGNRHYYHHKERGCNYGNSAYLEDKVIGSFRDWDEMDEMDDLGVVEHEIEVPRRRKRRRASPTDSEGDESWESEEGDKEEKRDEWIERENSLPGNVSESSIDSRRVVGYTVHDEIREIMS